MKLEFGHLFCWTCLLCWYFSFLFSLQII